MKIAVISAFLFDDCIGGAENHIRFLCRELTALGHDIVIFKPSLDGPDRQSVVDGLQIHHVSESHQQAESGLQPLLCELQLARSFSSARRNTAPSRDGALTAFLRAAVQLAGTGPIGRTGTLLRKLSFARLTPQLCAAVRQFNPDVVWQHDFLSSWLAVRRLSAHYPTVLTNHQAQYIYLRRSAPGALLLRGLLRHYNAIIGPSTELTPDWRDNCHTIWNGVDSALFQPLPQTARAALRSRLYGVSEPRHVILCPRRWAPTKGVTVFIAAAAELFRNRADLRDRTTLVFVGSGYSEYPRYTAEVHRALKSLTCDVRLIGDVDAYDMVQHYQSADLSVIPSFMEAVSLATLESMSCQCPVIASDVGGLSELIQDGVTGWLVPPGDPPALARTMERVLDNHDIAAAVGRRSRQFVAGPLSWSSIARRTERVLTESAVRPASTVAEVPLRSLHRP